MRVKLTHSYRVSLPVGSVLDLDEQYARTLKALGVAEDAPQPVKKKATTKKEAQPSAE